MFEIAPNIYLTGSVVETEAVNPRKWLEGHEDFAARFVGELHVLSTHDKKAWSEDEPIRIIEQGTGREEVWFPPEFRSPDYISVDAEGRLASHTKYGQKVPTFRRDEKVPGLDQGIHHRTEICVWYHEDELHREKSPAVGIGFWVLPVNHEVIRCISVRLFMEYWTEGEWQHTVADGIEVGFENPKYNTPKNRAKALAWIQDNCDDGFFPLAEDEDEIFGSVDEEVMFIADLCSK